MSASRRTVVKRIRVSSHHLNPYSVIFGPVLKLIGKIYRNDVHTGITLLAKQQSMHPPKLARHVHPLVEEPGH